MAYKKFDDASLSMDQSARKVYSTPKEAFRRALQSVANRVLGGTAGTGYSPTTATLANGGTGGIKITKNVSVVINGVQGTCLIQDNLKIPAWNTTMGSNSVIKYLVSTDNNAAGTGGTISAGNVIDKANYTTVALANAAAKLPDLPDGNCALGYAIFTTPDANGVVPAGCGLLSTAGTVAYYDLICMPYDS